MFLLFQQCVWVVVGVETQRAVAVELFLGLLRF